MNTFRKSIALLVVAWITIVGHVAVAMPFCGDAQDPNPPVMQQTHVDGKGAVADASGESSQDCAQHHKPVDSKSGLDCNSCGMCHMACHAVPSGAVGVKSGLPNRVYVATPVPSLTSFIPEQPQHVPLTLVA